MNLKISLLVVAIAASLVGCGGDDSSTVNSSDSKSPEITKPDPKPENPLNSNIFGEALAKGYGGTYELACRPFDNENKIINKMLAINDSRVIFDGNTIYKNLEKGGVAAQNNDATDGQETIDIFGGKGSNIQLITLSYNKKLMTTEAFVAYKDNTVAMNCPLALPKPNYFTQNLGETLKGYIDKPITIKCIDYPSYDELYILDNAGPITNRNLYIDENYSAHVGNMVYHGSDFKTNKFSLLNSDSLVTNDNKPGTFYISTNNFSLSNAKEEQQANYFNIVFDENEQFKSLMVSTPDTQGIRVCTSK